MTQPNRITAPALLVVALFALVWVAEIWIGQ